MIQSLDEMVTEVPYRKYTKSGVFRTKLSPAQVKLLERAGHGGIITTRDAAWTSLRSMADKGAVEILSQDIKHLSNGMMIKGRITAVRVK